jgi:hypothetical protein
LALSPHATDDDLRRELLRAVTEQESLVAHGRGQLPPGIRLPDLKKALEEMTRLAENDDLAGMQRFVADGELPSRVGARIDLRSVELNVVPLVIPFPSEEVRPAPRLEAPAVEFVEWFVDGYLMPRGREHSVYEPNGDLARRKALVDFFHHNRLEPPPWTERINTIVMPEKVSIRGVDGRAHVLPEGSPALLAMPTLEGTHFNETRLRAMATQIAIADWEEFFHHVDWAVWTATGESASPSTNRLFRRLGLRYEWWAHAELAVALYGRYDSRVLDRRDPVRESYWRNYPRLRHLVGRSPRLDALLRP